MATVQIVTSQITEHFSTEEVFKNQKGSITLTDSEYERIRSHAKRLEKFRLWLAKPMSVNGWYRTADYNKSVGGASYSLHLKGQATDVAMKVSFATFKKYAREWCKICDNAGVKAEIILYPTFVHFGSNWKGSNGKSHYVGDNRTGTLKRITL